MYPAPAMARASTLGILKIVLPLVGLSLLPLAGLVYAATASFGPKASSSASASASAGKRAAPKAVDDPDDEAPGAPIGPTTPTGPVPIVKATSLGRTGANTKNPQHTLCCEKLTEMSQTAGAKDKATLLAAASSCSAASSFEGALKQVAGIIEGAVELPNECHAKN